MEGALDELVRDVRAVEVARVDVIDAGGGRRPEHGNRTIGVTRRPEGMGARELHGAVAHAIHRQVRTGKREASAQVGLVRHGDEDSHELSANQQIG
jgi:hypothetical protein